MTKAAFGKTMENVRKHIKILKLLQQKKEKTIWCQNQIIILHWLLEILLNKPDYLGISVLELSTILMYEFWYDYVKPKLMKNGNCFMWTQKLYT